MIIEPLDILTYLFEVLMVINRLLLLEPVHALFNKRKHFLEVDC